MKKCVCLEKSVADKIEGDYMGFIPAVHDFFLQTAVSFMRKAAAETNDITEVLTWVSAGQHDWYAMAEKDSPTRERTFELVDAAWNLRIGIPTDYIRNNENLQDKIVDLANAYIDGTAYFRQGIYKCLLQSNTNPR